MKKNKKQKLFKEQAIKRIDWAGGRCQVCNKPIEFSGYWYTGDYFGDCNKFAHIKSRNKSNDWEYVNYFIMIHSELHSHETYNRGLENHPCVKYFLENYFNGYKRFYDKFIEERGIDNIIPNWSERNNPSYQ